MEVKENTYNIQEVGLAKALVRKGHECDVIFWTNEEEEKVEVPVDGRGVVSVFYKKGKALFKNTLYVGCEQLFNNYDVLQSSEYNQIESWYLSRKYPHKTLIYHGPYYSRFNKRYNFMCKIFDLFFVKSYIKNDTKFIVKSNMAKDFLEGKGIKPNNVRAVGVGIDAQMLSSPNSSDEIEFQNIIEADDSNCKLLYIGKLEPRRNIKFILEVLNKIIVVNEKAKLYMIGTGEPNYVQAVFEYATKLKIEKHIVWQEKIEQKYLAKIYKSSNYFILPTEYEIFGMVLLEAMYYGNIVLTTLNGGSDTLIENRKNGYVLEQDVDKWVETIKILQQDNNQREVIAREASSFIKEKYTWDALAEIFITQYQI
jgi:Glycosyltransferase